jgi:threonine dehydratase
MKTPQLPHPKLAEALGMPNEIWLKREDLHHYGSHKGRSIPLMINEYRKQGVTDFIISSSGNAALAAILAIQKLNQSAKGEPLKLTVLVGNKIDPKKLNNLLTTTYSLQPITIEQCERPKQTAFQMEKDGEGKWLRQSTDDLALVGYQELAGELAKIPNLSAVFIPTSSGTTAQGIHEGFAALGLNPQIHVVQTEECHPIVGSVIASVAKSRDASQGQSPSLASSQNEGIATAASGGLAMTHSLASAIVDNVAHRKNKILEILKTSQGNGWVANNDEITSAVKLVKEKTGIEISPNSALSVVGLKQAIAAGKKWEGSIVCLITGK